MLAIQKNKLHLQHKRRLFKSGLAIILILIIIMILMIFQAQQPVRQARQATIRVARRDQHVKTVDDFYVSNLVHPYYTIGGSKANGKKMYVITDRHHHLVRAVRVASGINRSYVIRLVRKRDRASKITNVAPAVFNGHTVWVVSYENRNRKLCYHVFYYDDGKTMQRITNL